MDEWGKKMQKEVGRVEFEVGKDLECLRRKGEKILECFERKGEGEWVLDLRV